MHIGDSFSLPSLQSCLHRDMNCLLALLPPNIVLVPKQILVQIYLPGTILMVFPHYVRVWF